MNRVEHREGHQVAGAADVPDDLLHRRRRRRRRELPGDRPARLAADDAELAPQRPLVDLDDDAVDLVVEPLAPLLPPVAALDDALDALVVLGIGIDLEAALAQPRDLVHVGRQVEVAADRADPVDPGRERPFRGQGRVELADRAGGRVARVGEGRFAGLGAALVQRPEGGDRQVGLAADFDQLRRVGDPQRHRADRPQVLGHVLADAAVAAGRAADQDAVLVGEADREAVDLRLRRVAELGGGDVEPLQVVGEPRLPGPQLLLVAGVAEREHRLHVLDLLEALQRRRPDPLRRRVRRAQLRAVGLDRPQLVEHLVVGVVADLRFVEDVVEAVVAVQLLAQLRRALGVAAHAAGLAAAASIRAKSHSPSACNPPRSVRSKWIGVTAIRPAATACRSVPSISSCEGSQP